jgi:L-seryl-tRNA(Ser) seleniumtransferase
MGDARRTLPSVDRLLKLPGVQELLQREPRNLVVAAIRDVVAGVRAGSPEIAPDWEAVIADRVRDLGAASLYPVINATGVVLHTNLGRAPLAREAVDAIAAIAAEYTNLELDVATGSRGSRLEHCGPLLAGLVGSEDALVVNNAAGALVLALNALAAGREVLISRGELIEIGGSFRIPDILEKSGAVLREVGTTNRTHLADYEQALSERTGAILVVHRSNFELTGFVASPEPAELAELARDRRVPIIHDVGSGLLIDLSEFGLTGEPLVSTAVRTADLVIFSGDKLLGGPQAGCVAGRKNWVARLKRNPYARALRADKLTLAALEATLRLYRDRGRALAAVPILAMLTTPAATLERLARRLVESIGPHFSPRAEPNASAVGGGSFPGATLPTTVVSLDPGPDGAGALALKLRLGSPSVLARVETGRVLLDPRTIPERRLEEVARAVAQAARPE